MPRSKRSARLLQNDRPSGYPVAVTHIANAQAYEITCTQLAVYTEVEQGEFAEPALQLQTNPDGPDLPQFEGRLLADQLAQKLDAPYKAGGQPTWLKFKNPTYSRNDARGFGA